MSDSSLARRTSVQVSFDGADITKSMQPYLISLSYVDNEEDETDDLQIVLQDREDTWLTKWLPNAVDAAASSGKLKISAVIARQNWNGDGKDSLLECGTFELDSVTAKGTGSEITIKATSLPFTSQIRQTLKSRGWEAYNLQGIAQEMASNAGMSVMFLPSSNPYYKRVEQYKMSDIDFLSKLCHEAGISLKVSNNIIILFDQAEYEAKTSYVKITKGKSTYSKWSLSTGTADTEYASCRVSYVGNDGKLIEATAYVEDYDASKDNQQLEISAKVSSIAEAQTLAEKYLRLHNKFECEASFTVPGDTHLVAGITVELAGWGLWNGKYIVKQAKHTVSSNGYQTQISLRKVLEGI